MIDTVDLVGTADSLVIKMSSGSPAEVVSLARYLADLARRGNFFEVAEAADAVERAATEAGPKRLAAAHTAAFDGLGQSLHHLASGLSPTGTSARGLSFAYRQKF